MLSLDRFDWYKYLELAQELTEQTQQPCSDQCCEAKLRCSISRAYYAAFCAARNYLEGREGISLRNSWSHSYVQNKFQDLGRQENDRRYKVIRNRLSYLRTQRNKVDYEDPIRNNLLNTANLCLIQSAQVRDTLCEFGNEVTP